jgi:cobyrinic acid a,c-diamide synthase
MRWWRAKGLKIIEASMGLFDGAGSAEGRQGSAADLAARFGLPVLLVLDVSGHSQSAAAVARGFAMHHPGVRVGGVVLNKLASERHRAGAAGAMAAMGLPVLGAVPRDASIALPERHLGLVQAQELPNLPVLLGRLADLAEAHLDLDAIQALAWRHRWRPLGRCRPVPVPPPGQRVALASDAAFGFVYPHVLEGWRRAGAELFPFSPLEDARRRPVAMPAGFRAATRNCMRGSWRRPPASSPGCAASRAASMASAAASW